MEITNCKARRLNLKKRPKSDLFSETRCKDYQKLFENIKIRMHHLAEVLFLLKNIYNSNKDLYSDEFLAFVGNRVIRDWPSKDFPFISENAVKELGKAAKTTGLLKWELDGKTRKLLAKKCTYEHYHSIGYFRECFDKNDFTADDMYGLLIDKYRVVWVTNKENAKLNKEHKSNRDENTYEFLKIKIFERDLWKAIYK